MVMLPLASIPFVRSSLPAHTTVGEGPTPAARADTHPAVPGDRRPNPRLLAAHVQRDNNPPERFRPDVLAKGRLRLPLLAVVDNPGVGASVETSQARQPRLVRISPLTESSSRRA